MKLNEILALAKAGYKRKDIEAMEAEEPEAEPAPQPEPAPEEPAPEPETQTEAQEPEPDYKSMYEQSQRDLAAAQAKNRQAPAGEIPDAEKEFMNFLNEFN